MKIKFRITLAASIGLALTGCQFDWLKSNSGKVEGVPLSHFKVENKHYFPAFIKRFFDKATDFEREFPTVDLAASGVKLIQVKPLNTKNSKFNEANLSWSADGAYLGFEVIHSGFRKIMLKDLVGNYSRELMMIPKGRNDFLNGMVVDSAHSYNAGLRWSKDSTRFAFMSNGGVGEYNIYVGAVGSKEKSVASSPTKDGYAVWNPKKNQIAFVSGRSGNGDIYLFDLSSKKLDRLTTSNNVDIFPEWSRNGNQLVYSSGDALNHNLMTIRKDLQTDKMLKPVYLTRWKNDDLRPTISPDGNHVAFFSSKNLNSSGPSRVWDILVVPLNEKKTYISTELENMVVARDVVIDLNTGPAWSPDGRKIFYIKRDPEEMNPIYAYDLFSGSKYKIATNTNMNSDLMMSKIGVLSFRAQKGVWDRVFVALTNQGLRNTTTQKLNSKIHYVR